MKRKKKIHNFDKLIYFNVAKNNIDDVSFQPIWNSIDGKIDRTSFHGKYEIRQNYPINVAGRTGLLGRGLLGKYGVNHAADPIVSRWKRDGNSGTIIKNEKSGK